MYETHELMRRIIDTVGAKVVAHALHLSLSHVYRMARHPMDADDPDGTGTRNDLDRIEMLVDVLAARPHARPVLRELHLWFDALFRRALDREEPAPLTDIELARRLGHVVREFGEFLETCDARDLDPKRVWQEGSEALDAIERLLRAVQAGVKAADEGEQPPVVASLRRQGGVR